MRTRGRWLTGIVGACTGVTLLGAPLTASAEDLWVQMDMSGHNCQATAGKLSYDDEGAANNSTSSDIFAWCPLVTYSGVVTKPYSNPAPSHTTVDMSVVYLAAPGRTVTCQGHIRDYLQVAGGNTTVSQSDWWTLPATGEVNSGPGVDGGFLTLSFSNGIGGFIGGGRAQKAYIRCDLPKKAAVADSPGRIIAYSVSYSP